MKLKGILCEMPHVEWPKIGLLDFKMEMYSIPKEEKSKLLLAFETTGVVAYSNIGKQWFYISENTNGFIPATEKQVHKLPHLPDDWELILLIAN